MINLLIDTNINYCLVLAELRYSEVIIRYINAYPFGTGKKS